MFGANALILAIIIIVSIALIIVGLRSSRKAAKEDYYRELFTFDRQIEQCKISIANLAKEETFAGYDDREWEALYHRVQRIQSSLRNCVYGYVNDIEIVKDLVRNVLTENIKTRDDMLDITDYDSIYLSPMIKFEIIMMVLKQQHKDKALSYMIKTYNLDAPKRDIGDGIFENYAITDEDIDYVYSQVVNFKLSYEEMLDIQATLVFQKLYGFGAVSTILEQDIDGVNVGASGSVIRFENGSVDEELSAVRSCWLYYSGKYIHLRFVDFQTLSEIKRITLLVGRFNNPGTLTEKRGFIINTMADQSRVLVVRPPVADSWMFFIRKPSLFEASLSDLLNPLKERAKAIYKEINGKKVLDMEKNEFKYKNADILVNLIMYLMMGRVNMVFSGRQGSGKTTTMKYCFEFADPTLNIRVLESVFEMYLRELYPLKNIATFAETDHVNMTTLQDMSKKSDGALTVVTEVATAETAARMVASSQVSSVQVIYSHHGNTVHDLITALTNNLIDASNGAATEATAMPQVIEATRVDIHHDYDSRGNRYIERVSEVIAVEEKDYPEYNRDDHVHSMNEITIAHYKKLTQRVKFRSVDILRFNRKTMSYEVQPEFFTSKLTEEILKALPDNHVESFKNFVISNWYAERSESA